MIYEVEFTHGEQNTFVGGHEEFAPRTPVIIQNTKGKSYGRVMKQLPPDSKVDISGEIVRAIGKEDQEMIEATEQLSHQACLTIRQIVAANGIDMKITDAAYNLNQSQLFVSFTSENRVDFRALLKELAATFRTRIELRQIGARDAAKIYGGVGPCGRPLCCSEFIYEFPNVSIKMAKNQSLSLKQSKLNGLCGRLMCCLSYEDEFYREARKNFPDFGEHIVTDEGEGKIIGLNILNNRVKLRLENTIKEFDISEVKV
ncbi:regulatory iron-sulfur-containing complex subunit RicT [Lactococcus garvieae]|uniref:Signal peptidase-like protein n=1 Tax=Lactococcus garvieae DCC43 TaxID=1231377 RepID=K2QFK4_9LACT|nr:regulatory iron-sulfur-containing complex subunit RicT [Lactococcus garvieae]EKF52277.1 Signal peptidase-like protein [Lactococcus garvieae DCC43]